MEDLPKEEAPRRFGLPTGVLLLTVVIWSAAIFVSGAWTLQPSRVHVAAGPWLLLALGFFAAETFLIHVEYRGSSQAFGISDLPLVISFFLFPPAAILLAKLIGTCLSLAFFNRPPPLKFAFNIGLVALEVGLATFLHATLTSPDNFLTPAGWLGAFAAILASASVTLSSVMCAIALSERRLPGAVALMMAVGVLISAFSNTSLGLVTVIVMRADPRGLVLLAIVAGIVFLAYRSYGSLRARYAGLELLYDFTSGVGRSVSLEDVAGAILHNARTLLRAEIAELDIVQGNGDISTRLTIGADGQLKQTELYRDLVGLRQGVVAADRPILVRNGTKDPLLLDQLSNEGFTDLVIAPLHSEGSIVGTLLVANRLGDVSTFDMADLRLFETLTNHASVALENGRLVGELRREAEDKRYQALHDALTGLANRTLFQERLEDAIANSGGQSGSVAVMLMDLDRFKEVNDTLGHHNGDLLLQEISARLQNAAGEADTIARFGGDEFAILVRDAQGETGSILAAQRILDVLHEPLLLSEVTLDIGASIGISLYPNHGDDATTLLQRADVAMYSAKEGQVGYEVYDSTADQYSPRRLALLGELRAAIDQRELTVDYMPIVDFGAAKVTGVEALLRWQHPRHGFIPPDEFIPVAEHTDLIRPLTLYVLGVALQQVATWKRIGIELDMSVNISARNLLDTSLPEEVSRLLTLSKVNPSQLTLEVTEGSIMADPHRTISVLNRLSDLGLHLSIDDFGTGYSSLSYLKRLPVDEVKIDRSFVMNMVDDENDAAIVRSTVDLGHNLGLRVVAEGIEEEDVYLRLEALGCDLGQGFHLSKPVSSRDIQRLLSRRGEWQTSAAEGVGEPTSAN